MPLANEGRLLFQTTIRNLSTHVRLKLRNAQGTISYTPTEAITFSAPDAQQGIRTFVAYTFSIALQDSPIEVLGIQLTNSTASVIYMESDFPTAQIFNNDGIFSLTGVIASFF